MFPSSKHVPSSPPRLRELVYIAEMPGFAFTVGSFGDIIAMGEIIIKIGQALYRASEQSPEYQELMHELGSCLQIFTRVTAAEEDIKSEEARRRHRDVLYAASACRRDMVEFLERRPPQGTSAWNKITWVVSGPKETTKLRERLAAHRHTLTVLLQRYAVFYSPPKSRTT
jgi:hypothetical protein